MEQSVVIAIDHSPQSENAVKCEGCCIDFHHLFTRSLEIFCQIPTLHYRRITGDMVETYKIITRKYQGCVAPSLIKEEIC